MLEVKEWILPFPEIVWEVFVPKLFIGSTDT